MGNINRMVDIVVLLILTGLSVSDIRNKKVSRKVLTLAIMILGGYLGFWKVVGVLAAAFFTSGVCSVILAFRGRVKTMPFFPFLTLGYILMLAEQGGAA